MTSTCLEQITQFNVTAVRLPFVIEITVMHLLWVTCIQVHVAVISTHNRSFLWLMDWIETFVAQEENGKHCSRLWCTGCWVQTKNRIKKTKKESVFSPSHLLASSALFRSLSGRASSQSSIVLISFPLLKKERIHSHTSKWIRVHCFKNTVKARVYLHALSPRDRITSQYRPVGFSPITPITFSLTYCLEHQDLYRLHLHLTRSLLVELWLKGENCSFFFFFVNVPSVLLVHLIVWNWTVFVHFPTDWIINQNQ